MKATEVNAMTVDELNSKLSDLKEELFALRFQLAANQLENTARIKAVKRYCTCKDCTPRCGNPVRTAVKGGLYSG